MKNEFGFSTTDPMIVMVLTPNPEMRGMSLNVTGSIQKISRYFLYTKNFLHFQEKINNKVFLLFFFFLKLRSFLSKFKRIT